MKNYNNFIATGAVQSVSNLNHLFLLFQILRSLSKKNLNLFFFGSSFEFKVFCRSNTFKKNQIMYPGIPSASVFTNQNQPYSKKKNTFISFLNQKKINLASNTVIIFFNAEHYKSLAVACYLIRVPCFGIFSTREHLFNYSYKQMFSYSCFFNQLNSKSNWFLYSIFKI